MLKHLHHAAVEGEALVHLLHQGLQALEPRGLRLPQLRHEGLEAPHLHLKRPL